MEDVQEPIAAPAPKAPKAPAAESTVKLAAFVKELEDAGERVAGMFAHYYGTVKGIEEATRTELTGLFETFKDATAKELYPDIENIRQ